MVIAVGPHTYTGTATTAPPPAAPERPPRSSWNRPAKTGRPWLTVDVTPAAVRPGVRSSASLYPQNAPSQTSLGVKLRREKRVCADCWSCSLAVSPSAPGDRVMNSRTLSRSPSPAAASANGSACTHRQSLSEESFLVLKLWWGLLLFVLAPPRAPSAFPHRLKPQAVSLREEP